MSALRTAMTRVASTATRALHTARPVAAVYEGGILDTIGQTPVVKLQNLLPKADADRGIKVYAKCEFFNPLSSVKDRLALGIITDAEEKGQLKPGDTVIEATSGNTGIATAMVCAAKGYDCVIVMAESFSIERRKIMRMLGAKVILTPAANKGTGMVKKARELADEHGWFLSRQFENEANPAFHAATTGPEIVADFEGRQLDYWVTGYGTGGTVQGAGKAIKAARPEVKIVLSEPDGAQLLGSGIEQTRVEATGAPAETHPAFNPHPVQGWTPDFIPLITENAIKLNIVDQVLPIAGDAAIATSSRLAKEEGIFTGISGGATVATALEVAANAEDGAVILAMLPDTAERYLSTPLFASIEADMNEAETAISLSSPNFHMVPAE